MWEHRRKGFLWMLILPGMFVAFLATRADATTLSRFKFEELAAQATAVARVRCLRTESHWQKREIWTRIEFMVLQTSKGALPRLLVIELPGGVLDHLHSRVEQVPTFTPGEEDYLFLWQSPSGDFRILGWSQGAFRIRRDVETRLETVTQASASVPLFDPEKRQFRDDGIRNLPIADFQLKLKHALKK